MDHINRLRKKNHMIISIPAKKACENFHYPFMIKTFMKLEKEGNFVNLLNNIYKKYYR